MKRLLKGLIAALLALSISTTVLAATWAFYFPVKVVDTGLTNRTYVPVILGANFTGNNLINAGYINSTGNNSELFVSGSVVPYMLTAGNITGVLPSLASGSQSTFNLYTGYSPVNTDFEIVPGTGGNVTTPDAANLEITNNGTISGYVHLPDGTAATIVSKASAVSLDWDGTDTVTATFQSEGFNTPTAAVSSGSPAWSNASNSIDGNTGTYASVTLNNQYSGYITFSVNLTSATQIRYWWDDPFGNPLTEIELSVYSSDNSSWTIVYSGAPGSDNTYNTKTFATQTNVPEYRIRYYSNFAGSRSFQLHETAIYGISSTALTATGVTAGDNLIDLENIASGNTTIYVNSVASNTTSVMSIPDTANQWVWLNNIPYSDNLSITVNGVQQLYYSPNQILSLAGASANLTDRAADGTDNYGLVNFGSNSNLSVTYGSIVQSQSTASAVSSDEIGFDLPDADMPTNWFGGGDMTSLPLYPMVSGIYTSTGIPINTLYTWFITIIALSVAVGAIVVFPDVPIIAIIACGAVIWFGVDSHIYPTWIFYVFAVVCLFLMLVPRGRTA